VANSSRKTARVFLASFVLVASSYTRVPRDARREGGTGLRFERGGGRETRVPFYRRSVPRGALVYYPATTLVSRERGRPVGVREPPHRMSHLARFQRGRGTGRQGGEGWVRQSSKGAPQRWRVTLHPAARCAHRDGMPSSTFSHFFAFSLRWRPAPAPATSRRNHVARKAEFALSAVLGETLDRAGRLTATGPGNTIPVYGGWCTVPALYTWRLCRAARAR